MPAPTWSIRIRQGKPYAFVNNIAHSKKGEQFNHIQRAEVEELRGRMAIKVYIIFFPQQTLALLAFECNSNDYVCFKRIKSTFPSIIL